MTKMLAMALLLHGGLLGGMGDEAGGVDGSGEGTWTLATPLEGFLAASGTGELVSCLPARRELGLERKPIGSASQCRQIFEKSISMLQRAVAKHAHLHRV